MYTGKLLEYENWTEEGKRIDERNDHYLVPPYLVQVELESDVKSHAARQPVRYIDNTTIVRNITNDGNFIRKGFEYKFY